MIYKVEVISLKEISGNIYSLLLKKPYKITSNPGEFIMVKCGDLPLRRPLSIANEDAQSIELVFRIEGKGTRWLSQLKPSDKIDIMGPLGRGFPLPDKKEKVLVAGGGIGAIPLIYLTKTFNAIGVDYQCILGFNGICDGQIADYFKHCNSLQLTTMDGSIGLKGKVTDIMPKWNWDKLYACGPPAMMEAIINKYLENKDKIYLSLEERMACGIGVCKVCVCKNLKGFENLKVCSDGPVFSAEEVDLKW